MIPLLLCWALATPPIPTAQRRLTVAAAADLKFAMDDIVVAFGKAHPGIAVSVSYGSSGNFFSQISNGAPFDLFFSADAEYTRRLSDSGLAPKGSEFLYARGRIVLWVPKASRVALERGLASLAAPEVRRIAIANPKHAPYGQRAEEALRAAGVWKQVEPKLVYGENIAHTAQFVQTGNAQVGIIALSLAVNPELSKRGGYWLIPSDLHAPLEQGFVVTKRAAGNALAKRFAEYIGSEQARAVMIRYGFVLPGEAASR